MAKGKQKHQARLDAINLLGKDLARRASQRCELCEGKEDLRPYDTAPDDEPSFDTIALFCSRCRGLAAGEEADEATLRFLENAIWSDIPAVGATAVRLLKTVDAGWARSALETHGDQ